MNDMWRIPSTLLALAALVGCASHGPAPVGQAGPTTVVEPAGKPAVAPAEAKPGYYTVKKGDTLYRIALEHGQDYRELAAWNNIDQPGRIEVGQQLRVVPPGAPEAAAGGAVVKPVAVPAPVAARPLEGAAAAPAAAAVVPSAESETLKRAPRGGKLAYSEQALAQAQAMDGTTVVQKETVVPVETSPAEKAAPAAAATANGDEAVDWAWPLPGKVISTFVEGGGGKESSKGIDLTGKPGEPVQAAASGKVVYVGSGLRGYGNLVIVRHNATYLSAYAHNSKILVKEGQTVAKGQKIAEVGNTDADQPKLHFEIRRQGKPVDPLKYLPAR
jgi:lipoprotein NlpD